jgi:hypothetical protein
VAQKRANEPNQRLHTGTAILTVVGLAVIAYLLLSTGKFQIPPSGQAQTILSIVGGFVAGNIVQLLAGIAQSIRERTVHRQFTEFFGREEIAGIVPDYGCTPDLGSEKMTGTKPFRTTGVTRVVPFEDLRAATELAQFFDTRELTFRIDVDSRYSRSDLPKEAVVAIGLGFNFVTRALLEHSCIAEIVSVPHDVDRDADSDDFTVGGKAHPQPGKLDYALVARVPVLGNDRIVPCFVCAGRTAHGTVAAANFLCANWPRLYAAYKNSDKDLKRHAVGFMLQYSPTALSNAEIYRKVKPCFKPMKYSL